MPARGRRAPLGTVAPMDAPTRARLRAALSQRFDWLSDTAFGPAAVEAGECDGCGAEARMVMTCGPGAGPYLGRQCLVEAGDDAYCDGHADQVRKALQYVAALPDDADLIARVWWVATGEVQVRWEDAQLAERLLELPVAAAGES